MTSKVILMGLVHLLLYHISPISSTQFEKLISSTYFVDKTLMIKTLFENTRNTPYVMITCPKLFGKSVNLDMIKRFTEIEFDQTRGAVLSKQESSNYQLFTNKSLKISQHKILIKEHLAEHPVILLNLSLDEMQIGNITIEEILQGIRFALKKTTEQYKWLLDHLRKKSNEQNTIIQHQINFMEKILNKKVTMDEIPSSLLQLTEILHEYFQKTVVILIDDYDALINKAIFTPGFDSEPVIKIIRSMIGNLLDPRNTQVEFAVITGVNGILYNFYFLEMKTISHHRFLSCPLFSFYFGFTNEEMTQLLDRLGMDKHHSVRNEIMKNFNGYTALGNLPIRTVSQEKSIFNPFSVSSYLAKPLQNLSQWTITKPQSHFLLHFMKASEFRKFILELLHEKIIVVKHMHNYYENELVAFKNLVDRDFKDISSFDVLTFLALMFEFGYLSYTSKPNFYRIPNKEIEHDIQNYLSLWYTKSPNIHKNDLELMCNNLIKIINGNDPRTTTLEEFFETSTRVFKSIVSVYEEYMPKKGSLQFELRAVLYLAAIKSDQCEIGEIFERDFYENYPDTAKLVLINERGTALIILIVYEDDETLQEAMKYVKSNSLNVKQTITCKKIISVNLSNDLNWETNYDVVYLQREA